MSIRKLPELRRAIADLRARQKDRKRSRWCRPWARCTKAICRSFSWRRRRAARVIVSIFVNPAQFAPHEDFRRYPRTFAADLAALSALHVDLVWAPAVETMYPDRFRHEDRAGRRRREAGLEDAFRPHFFAGVATVVAKLLIQCTPDIAIFGEKDYQQLKVITQLARDLDLKSRILGAPIVREADGLALSSRNVYLTPREREAAPALYRVLKECAAEIAGGRPIAAVLERGPRSDQLCRLRARLPRSAPRRDARAGRFGSGRSDPAPRRRAHRADAADR